MTDAFPVRVNAHVFALFPPLEQAPDQTASRPFDTLSVIAVPVGKGADPVLPTATLIPAGLEVIRSPLRPVAVTVSVAACPGAFTVSVAVRVTLPAVAVIVTGVDAATELVVIAKVALVAPCATVTPGGAVAEASLLDSVTANPPAGAALVSVTVPCDAVPPVTLVGFTATDDSDAGGGGDATVRVALRLAPPKEPPMVTGVEAFTAAVLTVNVAVVAPAATVTLAGSVAADVLLLVRETLAPPDGAALVSLTVPFELVPPVTVVGLTATDDNEAAGGGGDTVNTALRLAPPDEPLIVTGVDPVTDVVPTANVAVVAPAATVTLAGTVAAAVLLLPSDTLAPPDGAALVSVTVPRELLPPTTVDGLSASAESVGPGGGGSGFTVNVADWVTPPPDTEIVTIVCTATWVVKTLKPPAITPAGTVTAPFTCAIVG